MLTLTQTQIEVGARALKTVALAHGEFEETERAVLGAITHALGVEVDLDALEPIEPSLVAETFTDPELKTKLLQALVVMALADGEATKDEAAVLTKFGKALGVDEGSVSAVKKLAEGHLFTLRFDLARRMPILRQVASATWKEEGIKGIWKLFKTARGTDQDPEVAWKFKKLGLLPEGTLGREFWVHMTRNGFAFPGELGGLPERAVHHDVTHVLAGYDTDALGETRIASFYAGMLDSDPFALVLGTMVMFHVGVKLSPIATPAHLQWKPEEALAALQRGARCKVKLWDGWDYWAIMDRTIPDLRREYGIGDP